MLYKKLNKKGPVTYILYPVQRAICNKKVVFENMYVVYFNMRWLPPCGHD